MSWRGGSFLVGKILINLRILRDLFLIRVPLIRVNRKVQDISLYIYIYIYIYIFVEVRLGHAGLIGFFILVGSIGLLPHPKTSCPLQGDAFSDIMGPSVIWHRCFGSPSVCMKLTGLGGPSTSLTCQALNLMTRASLLDNFNTLRVYLESAYFAETENFLLKVL